jgi:hypothetical protein
MTAMVGGVESAASAYAILPFIVNGGFLMSSGAFNSCLVPNLTAPAKTPLGWSKAAGLWTTEPASGPPTGQAPLPNCSGYPQYMNTYSGWGAASYNLSLVGYKYLNISVWTSTSGAQLAQGAPEICGDAPLTAVTQAQISTYGPKYLTQNAWTTYKIPVSVAFSDISSHVTQSAFYKITWGFSGTPSNTTPIYIEYWFSVN